MIRRMATTTQSPWNQAGSNQAGGITILCRAGRWLAGGGRWLAVCFVVLTVLARPVPVRAEDDPDKRDARLEGFTQVDPDIKSDPPKYMDRTVALEKSGTGGTWVIFVLIVVIAMAALFKNAKRTHLD